MEFKKNIRLIGFLVSMGILILVFGYYAYFAYDFQSKGYNCRPSDLIKCNSFEIEEDTITIKLELDENIEYDFGESFFKMPNVRFWKGQSIFTTVLCKEDYFEQKNDYLEVSWTCEKLKENMDAEYYDQILIEWDVRTTETRSFFRELETLWSSAIENVEKTCNEDGEKLICETNLLLNYLL